MRHARALLLITVIAAGCPGKRTATGPKTISNTGTNTAAGTWQVFVQAGAKWTLLDTYTEEGEQQKRLTCEVTSVRTLGDATVADLKWWTFWGDGDEQYDSYGLPSRVAVTTKGIWFVDGMDDPTIRSELAGPPTHPDPPVEIPDMTRDDGKYVHVQGDASETIVCVGDGPLPGAGPCEDVCFGEMCISSVRGVISVSGTYAPNYGTYEAESGGAY